MQIQRVRLSAQTLPLRSVSIIDPPSEKENRENLPNASLGYEEEEARSRTLLEEVLKEIWSQVLNISYVNIYQNFFDLGGDALRSLEVLCLAKQKGLHFSLQQFFQHPTIHELAQFLQPNC